MIKGQPRKTESDSDFFFFKITEQVGQASINIAIIAALCTA